MIREILTRLPGALLVPLVPLMLACGDPAGVESPPPVASVTVVTTPAGGTIEVGGTATVAATPLDAAGRALSGRAVAFTSSAHAVATVSVAGVVTAVAPGTTTITATSGGKSAQAAITVVAPAAPERAVAGVTLDATAITLEGGATRQLVATPRDAEGEPIAGLVLTWTTSDAAVATVSATGLVTALEMGAATITATVSGKSAPSAVVVQGSSPFDLLLDRWGATAGGLTRSSLHRLDLRTPGAVPASIFEIAGSSDASPSPDGSRLAFVCASDVGPSICVVNVDGSAFVELTAASTLLADQPAWSPDGTRIAFRGWAPGGSPGPFNPSRIWVMNADGSGKAELTGGAGATGWQQSPTW
ncbi:MAG TPA: Ig-like domain-containing protein, partial [Gemmatimonadaceae bacterium]|nr:Ig-like domain-containing protein [Gemmatimonadaceae bacterium]